MMVTRELGLLLLDHFQCAFKNLPSFFGPSEADSDLVDGRRGEDRVGLVHKAWGSKEFVREPERLPKCFLKAALIAQPNDSSKRPPFRTDRGIDLTISTMSVHHPAMNVFYPTVSGGPASRCRTARCSRTALARRR